MNKWLVILLSLIFVGVILWIFLKPSTSTVGEEISKLEKEYGEVTSIRILHREEPSGTAEKMGETELDDSDAIQQLFDEASPTDLVETDWPPRQIDYELSMETSDRYVFRAPLVVVYDDGFSWGGNHFEVEGENFFFQALQNADFQWDEIEY